MASPTKFSMQGALDVAIFDLETGYIDAFLEDCQTTGLEVTAEQVYSMGAGGAYIVKFGHSKRMPVTITHGYPTSEILAIQSGQDIVIGTNTNVVKVEKLTINTDSATTTFTALGDAGSEIGAIWVLDATGGFVTQLTQAGTASATEFTYTVGTKLITTSGLSDGDEILVSYNYTADATAQTIKFDKDVFAGSKKVVMTGFAVDNCSNKRYKAQLIFRKMSISDNFTYNFEETGDAVVQNVNMEALAPCGNATMMEMVIFDEDLAV